MAWVSVGQLPLPAGPPGAPGTQGPAGAQGAAGAAGAAGPQGQSPPVGGSPGDMLVLKSVSVNEGDVTMAWEQPYIPVDGDSVMTGALQMARNARLGLAASGYPQIWSSGGALRIQTNATHTYRFSTTTTANAYYFAPDVDNTVDLAGATNAWFNIYYTGVVSAASDPRIKRNMVPWDFDALSLVARVKPKTFTSKFNGNKQVSHIAQELPEIFRGPDEDGPITLSEGRLIAALFLAAKQLDAKITAAEGASST